MFWAEIWKWSEALSENFQFLVGKFSIYLNRCVFVIWYMICDLQVACSNLVSIWFVCSVSMECCFCVAISHNWALPSSSDAGDEGWCYMTVTSPGYQESRSSKKHSSGQVLFKLKQTNNNELKDIASYKKQLFEILFACVIFFLQWSPHFTFQT